MTKRERLELTFAGEATDRPPVAVWRPFPGDDQRAADMAHAHLDFQRRYDWDFLVVVPSDNYAVIDYGAQDVWHGQPDGQREITRHPVRRSLDWTELKASDPQRGELSKQLAALRLIVDGLAGDNTPVLMTVLSPLAQARRLCGDTLFLSNLRRHPERLQTGLNVLTESTLLWVEALKATGIAGLRYVIEHAHYQALSAQEYQVFGLHNDRRVLGALPPTWWFNMVSLLGDAPMFDFTALFPVQAINWCDRAAKPDLTNARTVFSSALCGGLDVETHLRAGTPTIVKDAARDALTQMNNRRLIVSGGGTALMTSPQSNLAALRLVVETAGV